MRVECTSCFSQTLPYNFPQIIGGQNSGTSINCILTNSDESTIYTFGSSQSSDLVTIGSSSGIPIALAYSVTTGSALWNQQYKQPSGNENLFSSFSKCANSATSSYLIAATDTTIHKISTSDGSLMNSFYIVNSITSVQITSYTIKGITISSTGQTYVVMNDSTNVKIQILSFDATSASSQFSCSFYTQYGSSTYPIYATDIIINSDYSSLYISGQIIQDPGVFIYTISSNTLSSIQSFAYTGSSLSQQITTLDYSTYLASDFVFGCGQNIGTDTYDISIVALLVQASAVYQYQWYFDMSESTECVDIDFQSTSSLLSFVIKQSSKTILVQNPSALASPLGYSATTIQFDSSSINSPNTMAALMITSGSQMLYSGYTKALQGQTFSQNVGFVMENPVTSCLTTPTVSVLTPTYQDTSFSLSSLTTATSYSSFSLTVSQLTSTYQMSTIASVTDSTLTSLTLQTKSGTCASYTQAITSTGIITTTAVISPQTYVVGQGTYYIVFNFFTFSDVCDDLSWTYTVKYANGSSLPSFITYNGQISSTQTGQIQVLTSSESDVGSYSVRITGTLPDGRTSYSDFTLNVNSAVTTVINGTITNTTTTVNETITNTTTTITDAIATVFNTTNYAYSIITAQLVNIVEPFLLTTPNTQALYQGDSKIYDLATNSSQNTKSKLVSPYPTWVSLNNNQVVMQPPENTIPGVYTVNIQTYNQDNPSNTKTYTMTIIVKQKSIFGQNLTDVLGNTTTGVNSSITSQIITIDSQQLVVDWTNVVFNVTQPLTAKISKISNQGQVTIQFSENMKVSQQIKNQINKNVMQLWIENELNTKSFYSWSLLDFNGDNMQIQVYLTNPVNIQNSDTINLQFIQNKYFMNEDQTKMIPYKYKISSQMIQQIRSESDQQNIQTAQSIIGSTMGTAFTLSLVSQIFVAYSLQTLWGMFNTLQFLVHVPLFSIDLPSNVYTFFSYLITYLTFDILSLMKMDVWIAQINDYEGDPIYPEFGQLGYASLYLIDNMGTIFLSFILIPIFAICLVILRFIKQDLKILNQFYDKFSAWLQYNPILRIVVEGYLELSIATWIQILNLQNETGIEIFQSVWSIILIMTLMTSLILIPIILIVNQRQLENEKFKEQFECLYEGCKTTQRSTLFYLTCFFTRRQIFVITALFLNSFPCQQAQLFMVINMIHACYIISVKPFENTKQNYLEIFNETLILIVSYLLLLETDLIDNNDFQYQIGWAIIALVVMNFAVNIMIAMVESFTIIYRKLKRFIARRKKVLPIHNRKKKLMQLAHHELEIITEQSESNSLSQSHKSLKINPLTQNKVQVLRDSFENYLPVKKPSPGSYKSSNAIMINNFVSQQLSQNEGETSTNYTRGKTIFLHQKEFLDQLYQYQTLQSQRLLKKTRNPNNNEISSAFNSLNNSRSNFVKTPEQSQNQRGVFSANEDTQKYVNIQNMY